MDPLVAVDALIEHAIGLRRESSSDTSRLAPAFVVSCLLSIHALLERIRDRTTSEGDIHAFCTLTCLSNIRIWLECRRHPDCAGRDAWPNILLLDLCNHCSRYILNNRVTRIFDRSLARVLDDIQAEGCVQLPGA